MRAAFAILARVLRRSEIAALAGPLGTAKVPQMGDPTGGQGRYLGVGYRRLAHGGYEVRGLSSTGAAAHGSRSSETSVAGPRDRNRGTCHRVVRIPTPRAMHAFPAPAEAGNLRI